MCGVAGYLSFDGRPARADIAEAMASAIAHRGPDGAGVHVDGPLALGHRRLAVLDLSPAAAQPMVRGDGRWVLAYNGEVYNFAELRRELEALGHSFVSHGDTEVVLAALIQWGADAVARFNGMFALAFWDAGARRLLLARDRYGIKPLYLAQRDEAILFGSEVKALLAHPALSAAIEWEALSEYMTFQNYLTDRTLFRGVRMLMPGSWMSVDADGRVATRHYWDFDMSERDTGRSEEECVEELDRLFCQAVRRQLTSDVDVGAYLSGGMDSGAITAVAAPLRSGLKTFTMGFDMHSVSGLELNSDERSLAELISYTCKTEQYEMLLKAGDMERIMPRLIRHIEEPRIGQSYPNFYAAGLASRFCTVVLSGAGGDEMFAGYPWRYYRAAGSSDFDQYIDHYYGFWQRMMSDQEQAALFAPIREKVAHVRPRAIFRSVFQNRDEMLNRREDYINHSLYFEAKTFLHGLLVVDDKLSMAHGIETRVPFLDNDLVDFAQHLPVRMKLRNLGEVERIDENYPGAKIQTFFHRSNDGKLILRNMMRRHVPAEVSDGEKKGFAGPDGSWLRGESLEYVRERLLSGNARIYDFFDHGAVEAMVGQHLRGEANRRLLIWSLLCLEEWCGQFLGGKPA